MAQKIQKRLVGVHTKDLLNGDKVVISAEDNSTETLLTVLSTPERTVRDEVTIMMSGIGTGTYLLSKKWTVIREEKALDPHPVGTIIACDGGMTLYYRVNDNEHNGWLIRAVGNTDTTRLRNTPWGNAEIQTWVAKGLYSSKVVFDPTTAK